MPKKIIKINQEKSDKQIITVEILGHFDESNIDSFVSELHALADGVHKDTHLLFDFREVKTLPSKGVSHFLDFHKKVSKDKRRVAFVRLSDEVLDTLEFLGLTRMIDIYFSGAEARKALLEDMSIYD